MVYKIPLVEPEEIALERNKKSVGRITTKYGIKCRILEISVPGLKKEIESGTKLITSIHAIITNTSANKPSILKISHRTILQ